jgi:hypothetical protein
VLQALSKGHPCIPKDASPRYQHLCALDMMLDGTLYDHLPPFHVEHGDAGLELGMFERRPSVKWNYPRMVAVSTSRKLFAGRQRPRFTHDDDKLIEACDVLMREGFGFQKLMEAVQWGSVGSVFMTFEFALDGAGAPRLIFDVWRARDCTPVFDRLGELCSVRVQYLTYGTSFTSVGIRQAITEGGMKDIMQGARYWFTRDYTASAVTNYTPIIGGYYSPTDAQVQGRLEPTPIPHSLGFVPGHWFKNLPGGCFPDGASTWACAVDAMIVLDYTSSQNFRGLWYNQCPELVTQGELKNRSDAPGGGTILRGPGNRLAFEAERKGASGESIGGGDAKLLESTGKIFTESREAMEQLRKFILETIAASRKDPDRMRTVAQSGRAMEVLDADLMDLVQDLRWSYGDDGLIPLIRKVVRAAVMAKHPAVNPDYAKSCEALGAQWPRMYAPNSQEFLQTVQALQLALGAPEGPSKPGADGGAATPGTPAIPSLIEEDAAVDYLATVMDFPRNEDAGLRTQQTPIVPEPSPIAETPPLPPELPHSE